MATRSQWHKTGGADGGHTMTIFLAAGLLALLIGAVIYGYQQAMDQAGRRPAPRPRAYEETDPLRIRLARAEWQREGWRWTSERRDD